MDATDTPTRLTDAQREAITDPPPGPARRASANGTDDPYCHVLAGTAPYQRTVCGQQIAPPLRVEKAHLYPPCANGFPQCPKCIPDSSDPDAQR